MYTTTALLTLILASEPTSPPTTVTTDTSPGAAMITATDTDGQVVAQVVVWSDAAGQPRADATFADGGYLSIVVAGDQLFVDSDDVDASVEQLVAVFDVLAGQDNPQEGVLMCGAGIILAGWSLSTANPVTGFIAGVQIGCECIPLLTGKEIPEC